MSMIRVAIAVLAMAAVAHAYSAGAGMCTADPTNSDFRGGMGAEDPSMYNYPGARKLGLSGTGVTANGTWSNGGSITITITTPNNFVGFLLYAVDASGTKVGTFTANPKFKLMDTSTSTGVPQCLPAGSTITHTDASVKSTGQTVVYTAPSTGVTDLTFYGIIVEGATSQWWLLNTTISAASTNVAAASSSTGVNAASSVSSYNNVVLMIAGVIALATGLFTRW